MGPLARIERYPCARIQKLQHFACVRSAALFPYGHGRKRVARAAGWKNIVSHAAKGGRGITNLRIEIGT